MCGIFGYIGKKSDAAERVLAGLKRLEYRGYDSWGVGVVANSPTSFRRNVGTPLGASKQQIANSKIVVKKNVGKIGDATVDGLPESTVGFGHTRWATHGGVTKKNSHPHLDCSGSYAIVHNGIIENYDFLRKELKEKGHRFISDTDSEVAAHSVEELAKANQFPEAVRLSFKSFEGLNGLIALDAATNTFVAVRNGSPLVIGFSKGGYYIASDASAIAPYTKRVYYLNDDEMAVINDNAVQVFNVRSGKKKLVRKTTLSHKVDDSTKGSYEHFMLKEIHEQPQIIANIARAGTSQAQSLARLIDKSYGTYMVGCGTAAYACMAGSYLFSSIAKHHINWAIGSEFGFKLDFLTNKSLVIALSQSGETMDTLEGVKRAKEKKAKIGSLVNVEGSTLYRTSDYPFLIGAGIEKGVASTKAFTSKIAHLTLSAYSLDGRLNDGVEVLKKAERSARRLTSKQSIQHIRTLAAKIKTAKHIYVVGRGLSYPTSLETALKIKEISYIHAEGFAAGELKHGVIALIENGTPCIVFAPNDEAYSANIAGAMEVKARGGYIIGVSHKPNMIFDYYINVTDADEATIIPNVMVGQLLAYYLTLELGFDPDMPRNLAKSVTVK